MSKEKVKGNWLTRWLKKLGRIKRQHVVQPVSKANPFLERTIEHWLKSTNELSYQLPFCQILLSEGYEVLHNSKQTAFEQGKDIIAVAPDGMPCGFQLKGNNISNKRWRDEVKGEIEALIELTIVHPSLKNKKRHRSYLVTNGELEDTVRFEIENLNQGKWKQNPLITITYGELLRKFINISNDFSPQQIKNYQRFLDLFFANGKELIDEQGYTELMEDILRLNEPNLKKEERKRSIATAVLYSSYIIAGYKKEKNYIAILHTLSLLIASIFAVVEKYDLATKYWLPSFQIVWQEMMLAGNHLEKEIQEDGLKKLVNSLFDGELGPYRKHLAVSYLFAFKASQLLKGESEWKNVMNDEFFSKLAGSLMIWSEAAIYSFILLFIITSKATPRDAWFNLPCMGIELLLKYNGRRSESGLMTPYYTMSTFFKRRFGLLEEPIDESFTGRSFLLEPLIAILARHDRRAELEKYWREITYILQESFEPRELWQNFLWRTKEGKNIATFPKQTQSWKELVTSSKSIEIKRIPKVLQKHNYFLPFFLLVFPHRINPNNIKYLDELAKKI